MLKRIVFVMFVAGTMGTAYGILEGLKGKDGFFGIAPEGLVDDIYEEIRQDSSMHFINQNTLSRSSDLRESFPMSKNEVYALIQECQNNYDWQINLPGYLKVDCRNLEWAVCDVLADSDINGEQRAEILKIKKNMRLVEKTHAEKMLLLAKKNNNLAEYKYWKNIINK